MNKYDICGFDKEQELNNLHNENDLEKELKEITLKADLDKAINYYVEYASINELKEQFDWYKVNNIYMLKSVMFESYLDNYNEEELKERIKMLYE
jgi:hypothetical protein